MKYNTLESVIAKYFPQEKIVNSYSAALKSEVNRVFNVPLSYFKDPNINLYQGLRLAETDNYWFIDMRYKMRPTNRIVAFITIFFFFILFGKQFLVSDEWFLAGIFALFVAYLFIHLYFLYHGLLVNIYKKDWIQVKKENNILDLDITLPKYSKDSVWKLKYGNKLLDFLGLTISSAEIKISYSFEADH